MTSIQHVSRISSVRLACTAAKSGEMVHHYLRPLHPRSAGLRRRDEPWRSFDAWPPAQAIEKSLQPNGRLARAPTATADTSASGSHAEPIGRDRLVTYDARGSLAPWMTEESLRRRRADVSSGGRTSTTSFRFQPTSGSSSRRRRVVTRTGHQTDRRVSDDVRSTEMGNTNWQSPGHHARPVS